MQRDPLIPLKEAYNYLFTSWANETIQTAVKTKWETLNAKERRELIARISPQAPESQQNPTALVDGKKVDMAGLASLLPELCVVDIIKKDNLIATIDSIASPESFSQMALTQLHNYLRPGLIKGRIQFTPKAPFNPSSFVAIYSDSEFGKIFTLTGPLENSPEMLELFKSGALVTSPEYEALVVRIKLLIETCVLSVQDLQGLPTRLNFAPVVVKGECRRCKKTQTNDGKALLKCVRCGNAEYCSKDCQVQDWKAGHKQNCVAPQ
ncbi:UNVERIFIED_CONTAM: hypothetical protein HDU68_011656 [Siphonaria sp. JEL0065]|nr:hypothetical protein HDU68_011656 [Siphonaria sp. JEL0065]